MDTFWTVARVVVSLAVVLGLVWVLGQAARRRGLGGGAQTAVTVVGRQALSRSASVAVVRVGGQALVLGVTDSSVTLLGSVDPAELSVPGGTSAETPATTSAAAAQQEVPAFERVMAAVGSQPQPGPRPAIQLLPQPATRAELRARAGVSAPAGPEQGAAPSVLAGSALSPATWTRAVGALRERSARR